VDLKDVLYQMMQENTAAGQPTDLRVGTVTREEPLEITINPATSPLRRRQLCLTEPVIEKKIPVLAHRHRIQTLSHTHDFLRQGLKLLLFGQADLLIVQHLPVPRGQQGQQAGIQLNWIHSASPSLSRAPAGFRPSPSRGDLPYRR
jgi:hypothetical protein